MGKYVHDPASISTGEAGILADLIAALHEPTIAELADQVQQLRAEVQELRDKQAPGPRSLPSGRR